MNAPELVDGALLGIDDFAKEAGIAASTLRAYITRGEADVPASQTTDGGRKRWSRPVLHDWIEQRRRDPSNVVIALSSDPEDQLSPGLRYQWKRLSEDAFRVLWGQPASRRRWSRPHRNEQAVQSVADQIGWNAALQLESTVPFEALAKAIEYTVLWELADYSESGMGSDHFSFMRNTGRLLGWFIQYKPSYAPALFGGIVRQAEQTLSIPPTVTKKSIWMAIVHDGGFDGTDQQLQEFFTVTLPPEK